MVKNRIYIAGGTAACQIAGRYLADLGFPITDTASEDVGHVILDVPSFGPGGQLRMGGSVDNLLQALPSDVTIYGGNLAHPSLAEHRTVDFLQDPTYLAENAWITAECALDVALPYLPVTLRRCPTLIVGWGRIGKCLGKLLQAIGADVTIAARKESDRAMLQALGYKTANTETIENLAPFRLVFNTAPAPVISAQVAQTCGENCILIELASRDGIDHENVIVARGLPGIHMPESSGILIAETFLRYYKEDTP